jgi:hypothetical protein
MYLMLGTTFLYNDLPPIDFQPKQLKTNWGAKKNSHHDSKHLLHHGLKNGCEGETEL